jgi:hypothetical protein
MSKQLIAAIEGNDFEAATKLLDAGTKLPEKKLQEAPTTAARNGHEPLLSLLLERFKPAIDSDVVLAAAIKRHIAILRILREAGADIDVAQHQKKRWIDLPSQSAQISSASCLICWSQCG